MLITRTPFRVSFAGGGTDLPAFYERHGHGAVLSTAIQRYMYVVIHPYFQDKIRIKYAQTEDVDSVEQVRHPIVRECLRKVAVDRGVEIASFADVASGTGLGSSSAFTVGLLHALYAYTGQLVTKERLAEEACEIEINIIGEPIGKQDQYAAAFGGCNCFTFLRDGGVRVEPLPMDHDAKEALVHQFGLYFLGGCRASREILKEQRDNIAGSQHIFEQHLQLLEQVKTLRRILMNGKLHQIGPLLDQGWRIKAGLASGISSEHVSQLYRQAVSYGALGGKLLGAGGTGFLLLQHESPEQLASMLGCRMLPLTLDTQGTTLLYYG